jgi:hypothetical protein
VPAAATAHCGPSKAMPCSAGRCLCSAWQAGTRAINFSCATNCPDHCTGYCNSTAITPPVSHCYMPLCSAALKTIDIGLELTGFGLSRSQITLNHVNSQRVCFETGVCLKTRCCLLPCHKAACLVEEKHCPRSEIDILWGWNDHKLTRPRRAIQMG